MLRIFPLKSVSSGRRNEDGRQRGRAAPAPGPQKDNSRLIGNIVSSRYAPELLKNSPAARSSKSHASSPGEHSVPVWHERAGGTGGSSKLGEHWCPACFPAAANGVLGDTLPVGDENTESKEVEKSVVSCRQGTGDHRHGARSRHPSVDLDHSASREKLDSREKIDIEVGFDSVLANAMKSAARVPSINTSSSNRGGLGAVGNLMHERLQSNPATKSKIVISDRSTQNMEQTPRSTSVPNNRFTRSKSQSEPRGPWLQSMRIPTPKLPHRVFGASSLSSTDSTVVSDASSGNASPAPRPRATSPRSKADSHERERLMNLPPVRPHHSRAHSYSECLSSSTKPPLSSPSFGRKPIWKESGAEPYPSAAEVISKAQQSSNHSRARTVAERLAKAFLGYSKTNDGNSTLLDRGERRTKLGQSKIMTIQEEIPDLSYDGSCSDTCSLQTGDQGAFRTNALQLGRPGDLPSSHSREDSSGSTTGASALSSQDFFTGGRVSNDPLNDRPFSEESRSRDSSQILKNVGVTTGSSHRNFSANDGYKSPTHRSHYSPSRQERERENLKGRLEGLKQQTEVMTHDLEMKSRMAEQGISALSGEQSFVSNDILHDHRALDEDGRSNLAAGIKSMQQRIKRMHEEKKRLALEVASEVKRRIAERAAAKDVIVMMKREMEGCVRVMEREKMEIQAGFERELEMRDNEWQKKVEDFMLEEKWLRDRVHRLDDEKESERAAVATREGSLREKVREFESQVEGHKIIVEDAERTILDLRQSLVSSCQQTRQAKSELENVRKAYLEKENDSEELAKEIGRLQQLCADHESCIEELQQGLRDGFQCSSNLNEQTSDSVRKELVRLSTVERTLREDLDVLISEMISLYNVNKELVERLGDLPSITGVGGFDSNLQAELGSLQSRTTELQEKSQVLSSKLQHAETQRARVREAVGSLESNLSGVEVDSNALPDEVGRETSEVQEKEKEKEREKERNETGKKDDVIHSLEQSLSDLTRSTDAQNGRIMQLTNKNGDLSKRLQGRGDEVVGLRSEVLEDSQSGISCNHKIDEAHDVKQELESQNLLCKLLRENLSQKEDELNKRCEEVVGLIRSRDWFQAELQRAQGALGEASQRLATLERTVNQQEDLISSCKAEKQGHLQDLLKLREALPRVENERDEIQQEADDVGREALRLSAEVEVLRRKVAQLEEDVLLKEGQISILRGSCFGASE